MFNLSSDARSKDLLKNRVGGDVGSWGRGVVGSWGRGVVGSWGPYRSIGVLAFAVCCCKDRFSSLYDSIGAIVIVLVVVIVLDRLITGRRAEPCSDGALPCVPDGDELYPNSCNTASAARRPAPFPPRILITRSISLTMAALRAGSLYNCQTASAIRAGTASC
jgi:hypothetical protein